MKLRTLVSLLAASTLAVAAHAADNTLTAAEKAAGWTLLFDGKTLSGWRGYAGTPLAGRQVVVRTLSRLPKARHPNIRGTELITEKKYRDFELAWEWKLPPAGNNGIKYFVTEARPKSPGHEYQMLDDVGHPDGKIGAHRQTASFYEVLPPAADKP